MRLLVLFALLVAAGCGQQIGDSCIVSTDCAIDGTRSCDITMRDGYCTILGCDYDTCPGESACVRFFTGGFTNRPCGPNAPEGSPGCSLDELCSLEGECVPRSAEQRFCMKKCDQTSDCRDGYECRDLTLMETHGGEPVLSPTDILANAPHFCAMAPSS
jgi:hypothetical protein